MIRILCLNPAIDRMYHINNFAAGKQYRGNEPQIFIGGKGMNVARACAILGEMAAVYGYAGGNNGTLVRSELKRLGYQDHFIEVQGETRVTINIIDNENKQETEIIERGIPVTAADVESLVAMLESDIQADDVVVCSGIVIAGVPEDIYCKISRICERAGAKCFLDTNGENLDQSFGGRYYFFKPNRNELLGLMKKEDTREIEKLKAYASDLRNGNIEQILVSMGSKGALFVTDNVFYKIDIPVVTVDNTIGCGDCTVAGFAVGTARNLEIVERLKLAIASGIANAAAPGICGFDTDEVENYKNQINFTMV